MDILSKILGVFSVQQNPREMLLEKRDTMRIKCDLRGELYRKEHESEACRIVDIGASGIRLEAAYSFKKGEAFTVRLRPEQEIYDTQSKANRVRVEVIWCRKKRGQPLHMVGAKFADSAKQIENSWVSFILKKFGLNAGTSLQRRKEVRASSKLPAEYELSTGKTFKGTVYNIGLGGLLLIGESDLPIGSSIIVRIGPYEKLPVLEVEGNVARKKFSNKASLWMTGLSFINLTDNKVKLLGDYVILMLRESEMKSGSKSIV